MSRLKREAIMAVTIATGANSLIELQPGNYHYHTPRHSKANQRQALRLRRLKRQRRIEKNKRQRHARCC